MGEVASQLDAPMVDMAMRPFLAADIGGTHARIGLVQAQPHGSAPVRLLEHRRYVGAQWPSLSAILRDFMQSMGRGGLPLQRCAVAIAGYVLDDVVTNQNLPWPVSLAEIRRTLGIERLEVVNDFEALAYASQFIGQDEGELLIEGVAAPSAPVVVMGPGTGLGSAVLLPGTPRARVLPTEAGQIALAPGDALERAVLELFSRRHSHVAVEHVLSGPGLLNTYRAVAQLHGVAAVQDSPDAVSAAALDGHDSAAVAALEVFCALLGSYVGDLAMLYSARGGVLLAGGILPQIRGFLSTSRFRQRYLNKGVMQPYLQQVPVRLIEHGQLGVIGAAALHLSPMRSAEAG